MFNTLQYNNNQRNNSSFASLSEVSFYYNKIVRIFLFDFFLNDLLDLDNNKAWIFSALEDDFWYDDSYLWYLMTYDKKYFKIFYGKI